MEFFAVFIPGFLLATGIAVLLFFVPPFYNILSKLLTSEMHHSYKFFIFIILSYALGAILYRQSPDIPDEISAITIWRNKIKTKGSDDTGAVKEKGYWRNIFSFNFLICPETYLNLIKFFERIKTQDNFIKYPYGFLRNYLIKHGADYLLKYVPWCMDVEDSNVYRNRATINGYKTIIKYYGPKSFCDELIRHESNIRMFTSLWHVLKLLLRFWWILSFITLLWLYFTQSTSLINICRQLITCKVLLWIFIFHVMMRVKNALESSLHYLRLKEIVAILQQIHLLELENPSKKIWDYINSRESLFSQFCQTPSIFPLNSVERCKKSCTQSQNQNSVSGANANKRSL